MDNMNYNSVMKSGIHILVVAVFVVLAPVHSYMHMAGNNSDHCMNAGHSCSLAEPGLYLEDEFPDSTLIIPLPKTSLYVSSAVPVQSVFATLVLTSCSEHPPKS